MSKEDNEAIELDLPEGKKIYFASDFHLGVPDHEGSLLRERHLVQWLEDIQPHTAHLFLVGDLFDFWFEYKKVVPRGFVRFFGKLAEFRDQGIGISVFTGNHDMWIGSYFKEELSIPVYDAPQIFKIRGQSFFIAHGDGLGPGDKGYKLLKKILRSQFTKTVFGLLPSRWSIGLANKFSSTSRLLTEQPTFLGEEKESMILFAKAHNRQFPINYYIFGHRHIPYDRPLANQSRIINLGDWINYFTYAEYDGKQVSLKEYGKPGSKG